MIWWQFDVHLLDKGRRFIDVCEQFLAEGVYASLSDSSLCWQQISKALNPFFTNEQLITGSLYCDIRDSVWLMFRGWFSIACSYIYIYLNNIWTLNDWMIFFS
jgi:hypothetical protein